MAKRPPRKSSAGVPLAPSATPDVPGPMPANARAAKAVPPQAKPSGSGENRRDGTRAPDAPGGPAPSQAPAQESRNAAPRSPVLGPPAPHERNQHRGEPTHPGVPLSPPGIRVDKPGKALRQVPLGGLPRPVVDQLRPEQLPGVVDDQARVQRGDPGLLVRRNRRDQDDVESLGVGQRGRLRRPGQGDRG